jgi:hypothetical protein
MSSSLGCPAAEIQCFKESQLSRRCVIGRLRFGRFTRKPLRLPFYSLKYQPSDDDTCSICACGASVSASLLLFFVRARAVCLRARAREFRA